MTSPRRIAIALLAAALLAVALATPGAAQEIVATDPGGAGTVVTVEAPATSPRKGPVAVASRPRGIVVTRHGGQPVSLFAEGLPALRKSRPGNSPATFTGLRPGTRYTVIVGGTFIGRVTALDRPEPATDLVVRTADTTDSVVLSWRHAGTKATGGSTLVYDMIAQSPTSPTITSTIRGATTGRLDGIDPAALYTFAVTPRNTAGTGSATTARMSKSLAQITGAIPTPSPSPTPTPTPSPTPTPTPPAATTPAAPAPLPVPAPVPAPNTKTIYVCPDGYADTGGLCRRTIPYTFHAVTQTAPFTYHSQFIETSSTWRDFGTDWSGTTCPYGGTMHDGHCVGWDIQGYTIQVKDNPPSGWLDNGSSYVRDVQVKDAMPVGYTDDGTQWVVTVAKEARVVPA